jgi:hypothetical protein
MKSSLKEWITPISNLKYVNLESLIYRVPKLYITLYIDEENIRRVFNVVFNDIITYKCTEDTYTEYFWYEKNEEGTFSALTAILLNSEWIESLNNKEPLLKLVNPNIAHYIIITESFDIEILSNQLPIIKEIIKSI